MSARRAQGRAASSEQRCFEIMNMNDKTFIFSPDAPSGFFSGKNFSKFFFKNFFLQNFQRKKFFKIFFQKFFSPEFSAEKIFQNFFSPEFSAEKIFQNFFSPEFSAEKIFHNFFQKFFSPEFSAEYFFRITQRNPRIEFIGISFPFNQGFLFFLVAANNFFNSKNILICLLQFCFVK